MNLGFIIRKDELERDCAKFAAKQLTAFYVSQSAFSCHHDIIKFPLPWCNKLPIVAQSQQTCSGIRVEMRRKTKRLSRLWIDTAEGVPALVIDLLTQANL